MRYIVIGAGGIGGAISAYLHAGKKDVALIARGANLAAIRQNGLTLRRPNGEELHLPDMEAHAAEDDFAAADVIFVCVKGYSLQEALPVIAKAARPGAIVIPILNSLSAGRTLAAALPQCTALDGCIYTSSFIAEPGVINQPASFFRIVFGVRNGEQADMPKLTQIAAELRDCDIEPVLSTHIELDMFKKYAFISSFAASDSYFGVDAGALQKPGPEREHFLALLTELQAIAEARGLQGDFRAATLAILDKTAPEITTSMHKDLDAGKNLEKQELIFEVVEMAAELGVAVPTYLKVARHFGYEG